MVKYLCDRCEKELEQEEYRKHKIVVHKPHIRKIYGSNTKCYTTDFSKHLCDECYKEFLEYLGEGKIISKTIDDIETELKLEEV